MVLGLALLSIGLARPANAQTADVYLHADSVTVGERFTMSLVLTHSMLQTPIVPDSAAADTLFGDLSVIRQVHRSGRYLGQDAPGMRIDSVVYEVTTFALDTAVVPPIPVAFVMNEQDTVRTASVPRYLPVTSLLTPEITDVQDLAPLATFPRPLWPWVLLGLAVLLGAGLILAYLRRRQQAPPPVMAVPPEPERSPYEVAIDRLHRLEAANLEPFDAAKPFYVELSDVLRTYLEHRLRVPALERTTRELLQELRRAPHASTVPPEAIRRIRSTLELADLVKFADAHPPADDGRRALGDVRTTLDTIETAQQPARPAVTEPPAADRAAAAPVTSDQG